MVVSDIARICHQVNRAFCQSLGDNSQPDWNDAPEWQKNSVVDGVKFHIENPFAGPSASHGNWLKTKIAEGWVYGPVKDVEKKEHPCMVPYDQLPMEQKAKDYIFTTLVHELKEI